jgi:hypothetical protein
MLTPLSSRFAGPSIYIGIRTLILLLYITLTVWVPHIIYFWITVLGLCIAPFLFNPHQFSFSDFIIDYREFLRWMSRGNSRTHANSWVGYCRLSRTRITGFKRKRLGLPSEKVSPTSPVNRIHADWLSSRAMCLEHLGRLSSLARSWVRSVSLFSSSSATSLSSHSRSMGLPSLVS